MDGYGSDMSWIQLPAPNNAGRAARCVRGVRLGFGRVFDGKYFVCVCVRNIAWDDDDGVLYTARLICLPIVINSER